MTAVRWSFDQVSLQWSEYYDWPECFLLPFREESKQVRYCNNMDETCRDELELASLGMLKIEICSIWWNPSVICYIL